MYLNILPAASTAINQGIQHSTFKTRVVDPDPNIQSDPDPNATEFEYIQIWIRMRPDSYTVRFASEFSQFWIQIEPLEPDPNSFRFESECSHIRIRNQSDSDPKSV